MDRADPRAPAPLTTRHTDDPTIPPTDDPRPANRGAADP
jgi:hypothetical protein